MTPAAIPTPIPPKRILVVDDEPMVAKSVAMILKASGYTVETAEDGSQALRLIAAAKFDLVITDFALGKTTGLDLARSIKSQFPSMPIILLTAYGESLGFSQQRMSDIDLLMGKPFSLEEMQATLKKFFPDPGQTP